MGKLCLFKDIMFSLASVSTAFYSYMGRKNPKHPDRLLTSLKKPGSQEQNSSQFTLRCSMKHLKCWIKSPTFLSHLQGICQKHTKEEQGEFMMILALGCLHESS